jgi:Flp pilus assembly protein TadD
MSDELSEAEMAELFHEADPSLLCRRGQEHAEAGELHKALLWFTQATNLAPDYGKAWSDLGVCQYRLGRLEAAEAALRQATELAPDNFVSWGCLGAVYAGLNRLDDGRRCLEACRALNPSDPRIGWLASELGEAEQG